jgi:hypothetical protein
MMKTKFPEGSNFEKTKNLSEKWLFCLFEPEKLKYIKSRRTKVVRNMKTSASNTGSTDTGIPVLPAFL